MARKMAAHDRKPSPTSRQIAKTVKKIQVDSPSPNDFFLELEDPKRWADAEHSLEFQPVRFNFAGESPSQVALSILHHFTEPYDLLVDPFGESSTTLDACNSAVEDTAGILD